MENNFILSCFILYSLNCLSDEVIHPDDGVNSIIINYDVTLDRDLRTKINNASLDLILGVNFNAWRFRQVIDYDYKNDNKLSDSLYSLSRDINRIKSKLLIGDGYLPSSIIDEFPFRGVILKSNDKANYYNYKNFAPEIRGVAKNKSEIKVYQYGELIYSKQVNPGNFIINDLIPLESSGNLEMIIKDINGDEYIKSIPYHGLDNINPNNIISYLLSIGKYRGGVYLDDKKSNYLLGTFNYGINERLSVYSGFNYSRNYSNIVFGLGSKLDYLGSLSVDLNSSKSVYKYNEIHGKYLKFKYSNSFSEFQSDVYSINKYYFSGRFLSFSDYIDRKMEYNNIDDEGDLDYVPDYSEPNFSIEVGFSKNINDKDSLYLSLKNEKYKNYINNKTKISIGYNGEYNNISYDIYSEIIKSKKFGNDATITMNFSFPLKFNGVPFRLGYSKEFFDNNEQKISIGGNLEDNLYYNLSSKKNRKSNNKSIDASLNYQSNSGIFNFGYSSNQKHGVINANLLGSAIFYDNNFILGNYLHDSSAIIHVPGRKGIEFDSYYGIKTNKDGYAIITDLKSYRKNKVSIEYTSIQDDIFFDNDEVELIPSEGAVLYKKIGIINVDN